MIDLTGRDDVPVPEPFSPRDGTAVLDVLDDEQLRPLLLRDMRTALASDLFEGYRQGFAAGLSR